MDRCPYNFVPRLSVSYWRLLMTVIIQDILVFTSMKSGKHSNTVVMSNGQLDWEKPDTWNAMLDRFIYLFKPCLIYLQVTMWIWHCSYYGFESSKRWNEKGRSIRELFNHWKQIHRRNYRWLNMYCNIPLYSHRWWQASRWSIIYCSKNNRKCKCNRLL